MRVRLALASLAMATLVAGGCSGKATPGPSPSSHTSPPASASPSPQESPGRPDQGGEGFAIWPEDTRELAEAAATRVNAGADPSRKDATKTGLGFAASVLGWIGATAKPFQGEAACDGCLQIDREPGGPSAYVRLERLVEPIWSVTYLGTIEDGKLESYNLSTSVQGSELMAGFQLGQAASAEVLVGYGGREIRRRVRTDGATIDLGFQPDTSGHVIVLFEDQSGRVFEQIGVTLPAGGFAAS